MKVLFFGMLKDIAWRAEDQLDLGNSATLGGVYDHYSSRFPRMREMAGSILLARNQEFAGPFTPLADGDEIAFLPPSAAAPAPRARFPRTATSSPSRGTPSSRARSPTNCCGERMARWSPSKAWSATIRTAA